MTPPPVGRRGGTAPRAWSFVSWLVLVAAGLTGCSESLKDIPGAQGDYLAGKRPSRAVGMANTERMTDALIAIDGDNWQTDITTAFGKNGEATWDLGESVPIVCAYLQGDNNDTYYLEGSDDGQSWSPVWTVPPLVTPGMQGRSATSLAVKARYVKLHATGGDSLYSVSEVALYGKCDPKAFPAHFEQRNGVAPSTRGTWALPLIAAALLVIFYGRRPRREETAPFDLTRPTGVIVLLSGILMDVWPMAVLGLAIVSWPLVTAVLEPSPNGKSSAKEGAAKPAGKPSDEPPPSSKS